MADSTTKILWFSKFPPTEKAIDKLRQAFGEISIIHEPDVFYYLYNLDDLVRRFNNKEFDCIVVVSKAYVPRLSQSELKPYIIYPDLRSCTPEQSDLDLRIRGLPNLNGNC
jgi:hypothetical protein